jgi:hypothetical protein
MNIHPHPVETRRGFLSFDVAAGLALALLLLTLLGTLIIKQRQAESRLAATRAATRDAETALLQLQAGQNPSKDIQLQRLADAAPPGQAWVRLTIPKRERFPAATLVGLVPVQRLQEGRP